MKHKAFDVPVRALISDHRRTAGTRIHCEEAIGLFRTRADGLCQAAFSHHPSARTKTPHLSAVDLKRKRDWIQMPVGG